MLPAWLPWAVVGAGTIKSLFEKDPYKEREKELKKLINKQTEEYLKGLYARTSSQLAQLKGEIWRRGLALGLPRERILAQIATAEKDARDRLQSAISEMLSRRSGYNLQLLSSLPIRGGSGSSLTSLGMSWALSRPESQKWMENLLEKVF